jgi:Complex 1 protein (LYR family)
MSATSVAERSVLRLYRNCLKSAHQIPDASQRATYLDYTRLGFRDRSRLPFASREAHCARRDAEEQLERMNYYHSIREMKEQQSRNQSRQVPGDEPTRSPSTISTSTANDTSVTSAQARNDERDNSIKSDTCMLSCRQQIVGTWLRAALPDLHPDDQAAYSQTLLDEGFDSLSLLENEILQHDLNFAKKAHKRALVRFYNLKSASDSQTTDC